MFTGFMPVAPEADSERRAVRVKLTWSPKLEVSTEKCRFYLQDSKFKTPSEIRTEQNPEQGSEVEKYYLLDADVDHVRLIITPLEQTLESVLPVSIEIEMTGQKPSFISRILTSRKATLSPIKRSIRQLLVSQS